MPEANITKRALGASLKALMQTHAFHKISVGDICEHCGMHRKSFYYHFQDKYDLLNWVFYSEFMQLLDNGAEADVWTYLRKGKMPSQILSMKHWRQFLVRTCSRKSGMKNFAGFSATFTAMRFGAQLSAGCGKARLSAQMHS